MTIVFIGLPVNVCEVAFLKLNRNQDVSRRHDREYQMIDSHARRRPERDDESQHDW